jgi:hypothetical protein
MKGENKMLNPYLDSDINFRYRELLKDAENERLARRFMAYQPKFQVRILQNLGNALIVIGQSLKTLSLSL